MLMNEQAALTEVLDAEKKLVTLYADALNEASGQPLRKVLHSQLGTASEAQFQVFNLMFERRYYPLKPADESAVWLERIRGRRRDRGADETDQKPAELTAPRAKIQTLPGPPPRRVFLACPKGRKFGRSEFLKSGRRFWKGLFPGR